MTVTNDPGRRKTAVATAVLAGSALATTRAWRKRGRPRGELPHLELTAGHRAGIGTPLLLLHGITAFWHVWSPVLPYLEPHHDVIAPTLPGHAGGPPVDPQVAPSVDALADAIEDELDRLGLQTVHIAGNSLGGWLGIELARRGRARSLVLLSPAGAWKSQRRIELLAATIRRSAGTLSRYTAHADTIATNPALRWLLLSSQVAHPDHVAPELVAATVRASAASPVVAPLARVLPHAQVQPLPADHDYPVRVVWGDRDRVLPFKHFGAPMLERIPGAESVRLAGVGHVPMSDEPAAVANLILEVTREVDKTAV
ncbi:alpha/beta fold hydrolase [[Mycobacterium] nativiensis]|uniref:Alpha/beta fold hydrolase n=1 Tax=[Mycobacterium] nativiensis TaxID=2855503 RepID=A0ABU5XTM5_9MYCO|nr:alpha/beta fold hydrolase [Mycolicibacter sp. MYC340]MEB3030095.1 alpha/beta fold hydrolase [Mycolicibacter sp. MYC340]